jgi:pimeloyl-ACP methyl ester carboxylesterase
MRPIEILLSVANLLTFFILSIPRLHTVPWIGYVALIALLLAVTHIAVEGPRWQMIPAYVLTTTFFLIWLLSIVIPSGLHVNRLSAGFGIGLSILVLVISLALPILLPVFQFPKPTGPYAIGTVTYHWIDTSRPELFTPDPNDHRELMAQIWYPARSEPSARRAPYIQDADAVTPAMAYVTHLPNFLFSHFTYVTTNAVAAAPMADNKSSYPILIFLSGLDGFRAVNTFQIEALVSHGYIVVGLDQPGAVAMVRFPDGRQISGWPRDAINPLILQSVEPQPKTPTVYGTALPDGIIPYFGQDVSFTLDQLTGLNSADPNHIMTGRLDLGRAATFGISLGGMNAAEACAKDPRLKACLIMDVYMPADAVKAGLQQPSMFITRDADTMRLERTRSGGWTEKDIALTLSTMRTVYENLPGDGYYLQIPKMFHINFTDLPYWSPITTQLGLTGPIDGQRGFDIVNAYSLAFFDKHLNAQPSPLLNGPSKHYPEVNIETRRESGAVPSSASESERSTA